MNTFIKKIVLLGLLAISSAGCVAVDPFYTPQPNTYGSASTISVPSGIEGVDTTTSAFHLASRVPQEESMQVSWDLTLYRASGSWNRPPMRGNCEVLIKPAGSINYIRYDCDRVEKIGRDFMVYYSFKGSEIAVNLQTMPGGFVRNGFCEREIWSPAYQMTARVVWQSHETARPSRGPARAIGCKPG